MITQPVAFFATTKKATNGVMAVVLTHCIFIFICFYFTFIDVITTYSILMEVKASFTDTVVGAISVLTIVSTTIVILSTLINIYYGS